MDLIREVSYKEIENFDFFDCLENEEPIVFRGLANDWEIIREISEKNLKGKYGNSEIIARDSVCEKKMILSKYISLFFEKEVKNPLYLSNWQFLLDYPSLKEMYCPPSEFKCYLDALSVEQHIKTRGKFLFSWLFIGPKNTGTKLHQDIGNTCAWNALLSGKKQWTFYPPSHPNEASSAYSCEQGPGDLIYTPSQWWHEVKNTENTICLTENFITPVNIRAVREAFKEMYKPSIQIVLNQIVPELAL